MLSSAELAPQVPRGRVEQWALGHTPDTTPAPELHPGQGLPELHQRGGDGRRR